MNNGEQYLASAIRIVFTAATYLFEAISRLWLFLLLLWRRVFHWLPWVYNLQMHHLPRLRYVDVCGNRDLFTCHVLSRSAAHHHVQALGLRVREIKQCSFAFSLRLLQL